MKLKYDKLLSNVAFNCNMRHYIVVCSSTFMPIYRGTKDVACPTCAAKYMADQAGMVCAVCNLGKVGADASGLVCSPSQAR